MRGREPARTDGGTSSSHLQSGSLSGWVYVRADHSCELTTISVSSSELGLLLSTRASHRSTTGRHPGNPGEPVRCCSSSRLRAACGRMVGRRHRRTGRGSVGEPAAARPKPAGGLGVDPVFDGPHGPGRPDGLRNRAHSRLRSPAGGCRFDAEHTPTHLGLPSVPSPGVRVPMNAPHPRQDRTAPRHRRPYPWRSRPVLDGRQAVGAVVLVVGSQLLAQAVKLLLPRVRGETNTVPSGSDHDRRVRPGGGPPIGGDGSPW